MAKKQLSVCIMGHVDSGKSTLTGKFCYQFNTISDKDLAKLEKLAENNGKASFKFAYCTDSGKDEQSRGVTINVNTKKVELPNTTVSFVDCPGHHMFLKNAAVGFGQADLPIGVCPCNFETALAGGTFESHIAINSILSVEKIFGFCISKCDELLEADADPNSPTYEEQLLNKYEAAVQGISKILKRYRCKVEDCAFFPCSAITDHGLFRNSPRYKFYKGFKLNKERYGADAPDVVYSLEEFIDIQPEVKRDVDGPLRISISSISKPKGAGTVYCGRVDNGTLKCNDTVKCLPQNITATVKTIESFNQSATSACVGTQLGFTLKASGDALSKLTKAGFVVGPANDNFKVSDVYRIRGLNLKKSKSGTKDKSSDKNIIKKGYAPQMISGSTKTTTRFTKLFSKGESVDFVKSNAPFDALIVPSTPVYLEKKSISRANSRVAFLDSSTVVCIAAVEDSYTFAEAKEKYSEEFNPNNLDLRKRNRG